MAGLRALRKRLNSIRITEQLAGAMRTAAAARYARVNAVRNAYQPYREACASMLHRACMPAQSPAQAALPDCLVLFAANRGLCGGFNAEVLAHFAQLYSGMTKPPLIVTCGKKAESYCRDRDIAVERAFDILDIPSYEQACVLADYLMEMHAQSRVSGITIVIERFINMLCQTPEARTVLPLQSPAGEDAPCEELLMLPDEGAIRLQLQTLGFRAEIYAALLENAAGAQAATLMAMRHAYDNASKSAAALATLINRRRQAEVTAGVIETSSDSIQ